MLEKEKLYTKSELDSLYKTHYENFPISNFLLGKETTQHLSNIYAFCRFTDDIGDKLQGDRLEALNKLEDDVRKLNSTELTQNCVVSRLSPTVASCQIPIETLVNLIVANKIDQKTTHYETLEDLQDYCKYSANPVGRIVLSILNYRSEKLNELSDYICTALQLINFLQDIRYDYFQLGRIYIPQEVSNNFSISIPDLLEKEIPPSDSNNFSTMVKYIASIARNYLNCGKLLAYKMNKYSHRVFIQSFIISGEMVLLKLEKRPMIILKRRVKLNKLDKINLFFNAIRCGTKREPNGIRKFL